jgi:hypothetical protein
VPQFFWLFNYGLTCKPLPSFPRFRQVEKALEDGEMPPNDPIMDAAVAMAAAPTMQTPLP